MKVVGIDKARSKVGEFVLVTEPRLTGNVFEKFREMWNADHFNISSGALVWSGPPFVDNQFIGQTEAYLTEAENAIKADKARDQGRNDSFVEKFAERTGLPLL